MNMPLYFNFSLNISSLFAKYLIINIDKERKLIKQHLPLRELQCLILFCLLHLQFNKNFLIIQKKMEREVENYKVYPHL